MLSRLLNFDKIFTVFRNTRLASSCNSVLASQICSSSVHSPASKYKTLICLAVAPNGTGFQKRGRVRKRGDLRKAFVNVDLNVYGGKYKLPDLRHGTGRASRKNFPADKMKTLVLA